MRKIIICLVLIAIVSVGGCRAVSFGLWKVNEVIQGGVLQYYTGNGHFDGKTRWDNFTANWAQIQNFIDIHFFNYDIRDPYVGAPFFGDPH